LFASRWPDGFSCPPCGDPRAGEQPKRRLWECRACGHQTSVTAGTVMHRARTPLRVWFWAADLVATHHPGISAVQLKCQLGIARYDTAWLILHKLRRAMVAPERHALTGAVEVDDFYVGGIEEGRGGGRKSDSSKAIGAAAVELRGAGSGRLRLSVIADLSAASLCGFVTEVADADGTSPGFVESDCCSRRSCAQPKVVHMFFRSRAPAHVRPSGSPAAWSASNSTWERIPSVECSLVGL
jgi:hypothetical protein